LLSGLAALAFWALAWRRRGIPTGRWLLRALVAAGPATVIAMEAGWFVTEFGRQPWTVYGVLRTADAATSSPGVGPTFAIFIVIYVALAAVTARLLLELARRRRAEA
jgi:cytochrome d ubiquinol oxidase subunit I